MERVHPKSLGIACCVRFLHDGVDNAGPVISRTRVSGMLKCYHRARRVEELFILSAHYPRTINRAGLIIRPRQPYVDWANSTDDDGPRANLRQLREDSSIYLVECFDFQEDFKLLVDDTWEWIFKEPLNGWMRAPDLWPEGLTRAMFLEWFDCELSTMGWDTLKTRIKPAF